MKNRIFFSTMIFLFSVTIVNAQAEHVKKYLKRYQQIAKDEMNRAGVPASIKMAQGMLESNYGRSTLATKANNHFGMKCGSAWKGGTYYIEDDDYDSSGRLMKSCFRKYKNPEASYYAHSEFLKAKRYSYLFNYVDPTDYKGWAKGLKRLGYATSPTYAEKLISIIEKYELYKLDGEVVTPPDLLADNGNNDSTSSTKKSKWKRNKKLFQRNNDVRMVFAFAGETPADIAVAQGVSLKKVMKYNERLNDPSKKLEKNEKIYIQKKKRGYRGRSQYHFVKANETMYDIAQQYGIRLDKLYSRNRLSENTEPLPGEKIKLRGWKVKEYAIPRTTKQGKPKKDSEFLDFELEPADVKEVETEKGPDPVPTTQPTQPTTQPTTPTTTEPTPTPTNGTKQIPEFHVVQRGETLYGISRLYGMGVNELKRKNNILTDGISIGQKLKLR